MSDLSARTRYRLTHRPLPAILVLGALGALACADTASREGASCEDVAEYVLTNGRILTMDEENTVASRVRVRDRWIVAVEDDLPTEGPCTRVVDLRGRTVIPGLIDSHLHFVRQGLFPGHDVREAETAFTLDALLALIAQRAEALPAAELITVMGGVSPNQFTPRRLPTLEELDAVAPDHAVYLQLGFSGPAQTNSEGRSLLASRGVTVPPDGVLREGPETVAALAGLRVGQTLEDGMRGTRDLMRYANAVGLTMVFDEGGVPFPGAGYFDPTSDYAALVPLWRKGDLTVRVRAQLSVYDGTAAPAALKAWIDHAWFRFGDDMLRLSAVGEHIVTFPRDGVVNPAYGAKVRAIALAGWSHEQHSTSHDENRQHLQAIEDAHAVTPITDLRWSLTHVFELGHGDLDLVARMQELGMGVRVQNQGYTIPTDGFPLGRALGGTNRGPLYRTLVDNRIPIGAGTDGPLVGPMNPWLSIYYMVTGRDNSGRLVNAGETLTRMEALRLYTAGSAWFSFDETQLGSIETGKLADLVVLSDDYLSVPEEDIRTLSSDLTMLGGKVVYAKGAFEALSPR